MIQMENVFEMRVTIQLIESLDKLNSLMMSNYASVLYLLQSRHSVDDAIKYLPCNTNGNEAHWIRIVAASSFYSLFSYLMALSLAPCVYSFLILMASMVTCLGLAWHFCPKYKHHTHINFQQCTKPLYIKRIWSLNVSFAREIYRIVAWISCLEINLNGSSHSWTAKKGFLWKWCDVRRENRSNDEKSMKNDA